MKTNIIQTAVGMIALIATVSCTTTATVVDSIENADSRDKTTIIETPIRVHEKYARAIPAIIHDLKQCTAVRQPADGSAVHSAQWVIDFGIDLQSRGVDDPDRATVGNEQYWKAVFALAANDITALAARLFLLMKEGELRRAKTLLLFCAYDQNQSWDRDRRILQEVATDIHELEAESNRYVEKGIQKWDQGQRMQALDLYRAAQKVFPKNPWALWEIALDHFTHELDPEELLDGRFEARYELIRQLDPHFEMAFYQGNNTPEKQAAAQALSEKVLPSYAKLWNGEDVLVNMKMLGDGYFEMREYEFAIYAYKYVLFRTYNQGFNQSIVHRIGLCLEALGMDRVIPYLDQFLLEAERLITADHNQPDMPEQVVRESRFYNFDMRQL